MECHVEHVTSGIFQIFHRNDGDDDDGEGCVVVVSDAC